MFGTAPFLGLRLIQALSVTFGSSIVYRIMPLDVILTERAIIAHSFRGTLRVAQS